MSDLRREMALAARELIGAGYVSEYYYQVAAEFQQIAEAHAAKEREECAKIADGERAIDPWSAAVRIAAAIRARGKA